MKSSAPENAQNDFSSFLTPSRPVSNDIGNVEVYCRIKPCSESEDEKCLKIVDSTTLKVVTPLSKVVGGVKQELTCTLKGILNPDSSQKDVYDTIASDMITGLINGKNGLLFTYGITGSGKTYTLGGTSNDPGILPRCISYLYKSIKENLAPPGIIRLDRNGQIELSVEKVGFSTPGSNRKNMTPCETPTVLRTAVDTPAKTNNNSTYAIFISMVEIYNNNIYDLFDEQLEHANSNKPPPSKVLRENNMRGIFISDLHFIPVSCISEALTFYRKGKKRRKVAETALNSHSSRSHCVFTLYLVQMTGGSSSSDFRSAIISQLSLCDLAGSERTYRTKNEGDRQKEASSINSSLMTLRNCIEVLRDNQRDTRGNNQRVVPYRESRLTLMFRNFFEGEGMIRMILCMNPIPGDFEENMHVVRFAEITQEVKVKVDHTPRIREFKNRKESTEITQIQPTEAAVLKLEKIPFPSFPTSILTSYDDTRTMPEIIKYLHECDRLRNTLKKDMMLIAENVVREVSILEREKDVIKEKYDRVRAKLQDMERENSKLKYSYKLAKEKIKSLEEEQKKINLENINLKNEIGVLNQKYANEHTARGILKRKLRELQAAQSDQLERECNKRVHEATQEMQNRLIEHDQRLKVVQGVLKDSSALPSISDISNFSTLKTGHQNNGRKRKSSNTDDRHKKTG